MHTLDERGMRELHCGATAHGRDDAPDRMRNLGTAGAMSGWGEGVVEVMVW